MVPTSGGWHQGDGFGAVVIIGLLTMAMLLGYWSTRPETPDPNLFLQRTLAAPTSDE